MPLTCRWSGEQSYIPRFIFLWNVERKCYLVFLFTSRDEDSALTCSNRRHVSDSSPSTNDSSSGKIASTLLRVSPATTTLLFRLEDFRCRRVPCFLSIVRALSSDLLGRQAQISAWRVGRWAPKRGSLTGGKKSAKWILGTGEIEMSFCFICDSNIIYKLWHFMLVKYCENIIYIKQFFHKYSIHNL